MIRPPPRSPLFPSTPLSRSVGPGRLVHRRSRFPRRPRAAADPRLAVGPEGRTEPEQLWLGPSGDHPRSEEHTSELQSQSNLVCRLLLEKKKTQNFVECVLSS